jgi:60 kDa SS-A/Ro ribonucleoprotein
MRGTNVAEHTSAAVIAGIFTGAIWKRSADALTMPFGTGVVPLRGVSPRDSVMTISCAVGQLNGGGTDLSAPIRALYQSRKTIDLFIGITDSEDWAASGGWHGQGFLAAWHHYKKTAPKAQAVLIQLAPSGTRVAPSNDPSVHYVYGWSDSVLRYIGYVVQGQSLVDTIRRTEL